MYTTYRWQSARRTLVAGAALAVGFAAVTPVSAADCIRLENGVIHTMDAGDSVVSSVLVKNGRFAAVGAASGSDSCAAQVIDLGGRTVVPGIIDVHNHIILLGLRPGHDTRIESAVSIKEVLGAFEARAAEVPASEWLTAGGGFNRNQFVPAPGTPRFPTLAELNLVTPKHPVFIMEGFTGPSQTNGLGRAYFTANGVTVGADGSIAAGTQSLIALNLLRALDAANGKLLDNQMRGTVYAMTYAAGMGVTTSLDQGAFPAAGNNTDGLANFDRYFAFDALKALYAEDRLINRIRINFLHMEDDPATPELKQRMLNIFPDFGDGLLKVHGIGEFSANGYTTPSPAWLNAQRLLANVSTTAVWPVPAAWPNEQHSLTGTDFKVTIDEWVKVHDEVIAAGRPEGITNLRWVVSHVPFITAEYLQKLKAIGGGVSVLGGWRWLTGTAAQNGPPFRTILDSGIPVAMSSDSAQISPFNPWINLYYAVTGKNARGELINAGQQLTRAEAIRLYTANGGWFLNEEDKIGTIEPGKHADLIVLNGNYFDSAAVPDEKIKDLHSVLTLVNGNIVWADLDGQQKKHWSRAWRVTHGFHW